MSKPVIRQIGGSFAPVLDADKLVAYKQIVVDADASPQTKAAINDLIKMVELFLETPESELEPEEHPAGGWEIQSLTEEEIKRIWDVVPWEYEINAMAYLFEQIPVGDPLRDVAYHLKWYAQELTVDREPQTKEKHEASLTK